MSDIQTVADSAATAASHPVTVQVINQGAGIWGNVATGLITGLLTGGVALAGIWLTHHFTLKREKQKSEDTRKKELHYIATELVFLLERFADSCSYVASDTGEDNSDPQPTREPTVDYPELSFSDVDGDWRVLDTRLMYRIRELPVLQMEANKAIANIGEGDNYGSRREYFRERWYRYAGLGLKAIIQARRLRRMAEFPDTPLARNYWSAQYVMKDVWRIERRRRAKEAIEYRG